MQKIYVENLWKQVAIVPYVMPGFDLAINLRHLKRQMFAKEKQIDLEE